MNPVGRVEAAALIGWVSELQRLPPFALTNLTPKSGRSTLKLSKEKRPVPA